MFAVSCGVEEKGGGRRNQGFVIGRVCFMGMQLIIGKLASLPATRKEYHHYRSRRHLLSRHSIAVRRRHRRVSWDVLRSFKVWSLEFPVVYIGSCLRWWSPFH